jgi:hypothetical protein
MDARDIRLWQRTDQLEHDLFNNDFIYRLVIHPSYLIRQIQLIAQGQATIPIVGSPSSTRYEYLLLSNFLPIIAEQIGYVEKDKHGKQHADYPVVIPPGHRYADRINRQMPHCDHNPSEEARRNAFIGVLDQKDVERILVALEYMYTNRDSTFKFRTLFAYGLFMEENLRELMRPMCPADGFDHFVGFLNHVFNEEYGETSFLSSLQHDNVFNGIVTFCISMAIVYMTRTNYRFEEEITRGY